MKLQLYKPKLGFYLTFEIKIAVNFARYQNQCKVDMEMWPFDSEQHIISPYNITPESHIKVTRMKELITN